MSQATLLLPVGERRMSSWSAHQRRNPPSTEAGTDFYCPIGTPVYAPADGEIYGYGNSIAPMTGRWVGIDFDNGMRFRCMHHSRLVRTSGRVRRGDLIAYSGASGYGKEDWSSDPYTGGSHTHVTLWPTHKSRYGYNPLTGLPYTIDFMNYVSTPAGGGGAALAESTYLSEEDNMRLLFVTDDVDGNGKPGWALLNPRNGHILPMTTSAPDAQAIANSWARVWGDARVCNRQDMLNAQAAVLF